MEITIFFKYLKFPNSKFLGYILAISSAALAALIHVLAKPILDSNIDQSLTVSPIMMAMVIFFINGFFFTPLARKQTPVNKIGRKNLLFLLLIGIAESAALITYFFGLKDSTVVNASVLSNSEIVFSLIIAITVLKERLARKEIIPCFMIVIGTVVLPLGIDFSHNSLNFTNLMFGDVLILLAGVFYALDINICKYVSDKLDSKRIIQITSFASGFFALGIMMLFNIPFDLELSKLPSIATIGIIGTGVSTLFFIISLRLVGSVRTVLLYTTISIFGIIFSIIFLSESIHPFHVISIIIALIGIYFLRNRLGDGENEKELHKLDRSYTINYNNSENDGRMNNG